MHVNIGNEERGFFRDLKNNPVWVRVLLVKVGADFERDDWNIIRMIVEKC